MSKLDTLQKEYSELQQQCGTFDTETIKLLREGEERRRQFIADRKKLRQELIDRKGIVHAQLRDETARVKAEETAAKLIDDDAPLKTMPKITMPAPEELQPAKEEPAVITVTKSIALPAGTTITQVEHTDDKRETAKPQAAKGKRR